MSRRKLKIPLSQDWSSLDLSEIRRMVDRHLYDGHPVEALGIEPNKPMPQHIGDIQFVGEAPKRNIRAMRYRCSYCERNLQFSTGKIARAGDGLLRLIGNDCWGNHFSSEVYDAAKDDLTDFLAAEHFKAVRKRVADLVNRTAGSIYALTREAEQAALTRVERLPGLVRTRKPALQEMVYRSHRTGGILRVETMVPDEMAGRDKEGRWKRYRPEAVSIHRLVGSPAIMETPFGMPSRARKLHAEVLTFKGLLESTSVPENDLSGATKALQKLQSEARAIEASMQELGKAIKDAQQFLGTQNLKGIAGWTNHRDCDADLAGDVEFDGRGLNITCSDQTILRLEAPPGLMAMKAPDFSEAAHALKQR
jgi:hypothetical protein